MHPWKMLCPTCAYRRRSNEVTRRDYYTGKAYIYCRQGIIQDVYVGVQVHGSGQGHTGLLSSTEVDSALSCEVSDQCKFNKRTE